MTERATHTDYLHPQHLRVEGHSNVQCVAPSSPAYARLYRAGLPSFAAEHPAPPSGASAEQWAEFNRSVSR